MVTDTLFQSIPYIPSILAHLVAIGVAVFVFTRSRLAAGLLAGGAGLQLLTLFAGIAIQSWMMWAHTEGGMTAVDISLRTSIAYFVTSLLRALGELGVVGAVVAGVLGAARPPASG